MPIDIDAFMKATDSAIMRNLMAEHLPRQLGLHTRIGDLWITRVIPRRQGGFSIQYNLKIDMVKNDEPEVRIFYGHLLGPNEKYPLYSRSMSRAFIIDELRLTVPIFPFDPKLENLPEFFDEKSATVKLKKSAANSDKKNAGFRLKKISVLGYRLERRCVLLYEIESEPDIENRKFVMKITREGRKENSWNKLKKLEAGGFDAKSPDELTVPHVIFVDEGEGSCYMEFVDSPSLHDLIGQADFEKGCAAAGRLLRKLHRSEIKNSGVYTRENEIRNLEEKFLIAGEIFPEWGAKLNMAFDMLASKSRSASDDFDTCPVHRDFYDKQVLYSESRATLLDCEGMTGGDAALDIGNFLAHLKLRAMQSPENGSALASAATAFEENYGYNKFEMGGRVGWWQAASAIRLACLYSLRPRWRNLPPHLLDEAIRSLAKAK